MQTSDFKRFEALMLGMGEMYGKEVSGVLLDAYWVALRSWELADFEAACGHLMARAKFMPRPSEFTDLREAARPTAAEAWIDARKHLVWGLHGYTLGEDCPPLIAKIVHALGGANKIAMTPEAELHFLERRFAEHFETLRDATDTREALPQIAAPTLQPRLAAVMKRLTA